MVDDVSVVIVDLRDVRERQRSEFIPGSFHCPRGMAEFWVDPESPYFKDVFAQDKKFVFHCASGWRSALTVATLNDMGFEATHLKEGFSTWEEKGGSVDIFVGGPPCQDFSTAGQRVEGDKANLTTAVSIERRFEF